MGGLGSGLSASAAAAAVVMLLQAEDFGVAEDAPEVIGRNDLIVICRHILFIGSTAPTMRENKNFHDGGKPIEYVY